MTFELHPLDQYNQQLLQNTHPQGRVDPRPQGRYNLVVIGAGTGGLVTAAATAVLGGKVALIERGLMGGDCLNVGCVPSKTLLRAAHLMHDMRRAAEFGIRVPTGSSVDFAAVMERVRRVRAEISHNDSVERFTKLGADVFLGSARFTSGDTVEVNGQTLQFKQAVIATGARPAVPPIAGLAEAGYLTNETIFNLTELPRRLAVIGGGPIGVELAQAFQRLGSEVVLFHNTNHLLPREDADAAVLVQQSLLRDGVCLILHASIQQVTLHNGRKVIHYERPQGHGDVAVDAILVGAGRIPNVEGLNLEAVGVAYNPRTGITVNDKLETTNPRIYAVGDVALAYKFTHIADASARIVIRNALFGGKDKVSNLVVPWVTYTDPEVAHVGLYAHEAEQQGLAVDTFTVELGENDRARADGDSGFVRVHVRKGSDSILGATIVARNAGDMISELTLAMVNKLGLGKFTDVIHPYPTQAEAIRKVAELHRRTKLTPRVQWALKQWLAWAR